MYIIYPRHQEILFVLRCSWVKTQKQKHTLTQRKGNSKSPDGDWSPCCPVLSVPCPPESLALEEATGGNCSLTWNPVPHAEGYMAFIKRGDGGEETCNSSSSNCTFHCQCGYTYLVSVHAFNQAGTSPPGDRFNYTTCKSQQRWHVFIIIIIIICFMCVYLHITCVLQCPVVQRVYPSLRWAQTLWRSCGRLLGGRRFTRPGPRTVQRSSCATTRPRCAPSPTSAVTRPTAWWWPPATTSAAATVDAKLTPKTQVENVYLYVSRRYPVTI